MPDTFTFLRYVVIHIRLFNKKMRLPELTKYIEDEKFNYFIVESCELKCFGFNLKKKHQREAVDQLIQDANIFAFTGWKVARRIPKWVNGFDEFLKFTEDNWNLEEKYEYHSENDINDNVEKKVMMKLMMMTCKCMMMMWMLMWTRRKKKKIAMKVKMIV